MSSFNKGFGTVLGGGFGCAAVAGTVVLLTTISVTATAWICLSWIDRNNRLLVQSGTDEIIKKALTDAEAAESTAARAEADTRQRIASAKARADQEVSAAQARADRANADAEDNKRAAQAAAARADQEQRQVEADRDRANDQAAKSTAAAAEADRKRAAAEKRLAEALEEEATAHKQAAANIEYARKMLREGKEPAAAERLWLIVDKYPGTDAAKEAKKLLKTLTPH